MKHFVLTLFSVAFLSSFVYSQDNCTQPAITATSGGVYCPGETQVTLEITGTLGDATEWQWYTGSCGGNIIADEKGTSITVTVGDADSYFVRGIGVGDDNCVGNTATCTEIKVVLDNLPPVVADCPADEVVKAEQGICEAVVTYKEPVGTDNCEGDITVERTEGLGSGASFPVGVTTETYVLTDANGNKSTCSFTITVEDKEPPVITCPSDIEQKNDEGECGAIVAYKIPTATDNCTMVDVKQTAGLGSGSFFPVGTTIETYTATDEAGNTSSCSISIIVNDEEPPVITLSKTKKTKWPPNHKPFEIKIEEYIDEVSDNCPGVSVDDVVIEKATSDEEQNGKGDGNTDDDIVISEDCRTIHLLAERAGGGNGRVYTVTLALMDAHGNIGRAEIKAEIAHDNSKKKSVIDDGIAYEVMGCELIYEEDAEIQPVEEAQNISVDEEEISQLETYPNPVNRSIRIKYLPKHNDHISIDLYNLSGSKMRHLFTGDILKDTKYSWDFDIGAIKDKIFLVVIQGNKSKSLRKIVKQ